MKPTVLDQLLGVSALLREDMERAFAGTNLSETRVHALWVLHHAGPSTQQVLASELAVTPRSISALVDSLEAAGYVERRDHPADRRAVLVTLTDAAAGMMTGMEADHSRLAARLLEAVPEADREAFTRGLDAVLSQLGELVRGEAVHYSIDASIAEPGR